MGRKNKYTKETKLKAIQEYINGVKSINVICRELKCNDIKFYDWVKMFNKYGESIFEDKPHNSHYSKEFKEQAIKEYLAGAGSLRDIQLKYKILSSETLRKWILKYNNDIILTDYKPMSEVYTMKSRKVSYEERIEIVNYCIANNYDYKGTADKYNVPYSQVYTWVKKVKENGYGSLELKKKGPKPKYLVKPQTNEELLQLEIERLRREKERLELEVEVLKKKHRLQKRANIQK
jgi:transposase-like protein